jgi:Rieske Fe-S protein
MNRKDFIKASCNFCLLGTAAMLLPNLTGCSPSYNVFSTEKKNNELQLPLTLFEKNPLQIVRVKGLNYDIAVQQKDKENYIALLLQCTHADNELIPAQSGYSCSLHGSQFNQDGKVIKGPAEISLKKYKTTISNNHLIITI